MTSARFRHLTHAFLAVADIFGDMTSPILVRHEREYRICMSRYERAELATETLVGREMIEAADKRIIAERRVLREKMEKIDYLIRIQVDPEWTPHHLVPLHVHRSYRQGEISKAGYKVLKAAIEPLSTREIAKLAAPMLGVKVQHNEREISKIDSAIAATLKKRVADGMVEMIEGKPRRWWVPRRKWVSSVVPFARASVPLAAVCASSRDANQAASANSQ